MLDRLPRLFLFLVIAFTACGKVCAEMTDLIRENWADNLADAQKLAVDDGKPILVLFTGSDWCSPCKKLEKEVTGTAEFIEEAKQFVHFARLDLPQRPGIVTPEQLKVNRELAEKYAVRGYPSLIFVAADGRVLHRYGGAREHAPIIATCAVVQKRGEYLESLLKSAENADGELKQAMLVEALRLVGRDAWDQYAEELKVVGSDAAKLLPPASTPTTNTTASDAQELKGKLIGTNAEKAAIAMEVISSDDPNGELRLVALRAAVPAFLLEARADKALAAIELARKKGLNEVRTGSELGKDIAALETAATEGAESVAKLVKRRQDDEFALQTFRKAGTLDAAGRKKVLQELLPRDLSPINTQWLLIQLGFTYEGEAQTAKAIEHFERARTLPGGGVGNINYAAQQIARLKKKALTVPDFD